MSAAENLRLIAANPATSRWLRNALVDSQNGDPVDRHNDALMLEQVLRQVADEAMERVTP